MKQGLKLDPQQVKAVNHARGPLLIVAGAGTGKTTVVTERIKKLILERKVPSTKILALTFTEKAAAEMEERVDVALPYGYTQMWISTFHSFCDRILRTEAIHIGLNPSYRLMTEAETLLFLRSNLFKFKLKYFRPLGNPNKFLEALIQHFSRLKDEDVTPQEYLRMAKRTKAVNADSKEEKEQYLELANAFQTYEDLKIKESVMDFADLISNTLKLFRTRKRILENYQKQFEYILVDEFQDTNYAQNELAVLLAGKKQNLTVVGDDDQSIYRFRGSSISNMIQFRKRFPKAKIISLINNYRSTKEILNKSYDLIQFNNPDRLEIKERINKKLISTRKVKGGNVEFIFKDRVENEADEIAKKIRQLTKKKYQYKDVAILVRANNYSENFIRAFQRNKIPFQFLGPGRLFHQEEIKDLISYLKVLYNFEDSPSLYRVLNIPIFNLDGVEIAGILNFAKKRNYTLFEALENINEITLREDTKEKIIYIVKMIRRHLNLIPKETAGQIVYYFLNDSGILRKIMNAKSEKDEITAKNYAKFFDKLKIYETEHTTATVYDVVDWIDLAMEMGESPLAADLDWSENNAVNILTVHSSKGLEFPIVFLVNLVSQRFPSRERHEKIPIPNSLIKEILPIGDYHLEEERRLFYVGMTRAKDLLFLTASSFYGEGKRERKISPFIYEALGEEKVSKILEDSKSIRFAGPQFLEGWGAKPEDEKKGKPSKGISYLSYTQMQTFDICPLHYKLKYILKIPSPPNFSQSFGISVHAALHDIVQMVIDKQKINQNKISQIISKHWINEGYLSKTHERISFERAKKIILNYYEKTLKGKISPLALELPFNFTLKELKLAGIMDRVDSLDDKTIEIIDYKTGENLPTQKEADENLQLSFYALAAIKTKDKIFDKKIKDIKLSLFYLDKDVKITTTRNREQLKQTEVEILKKAKQISESDFRCSQSMLCQNCEYKILCQA